MIVFRIDVTPHTGLRSLRRCAYIASLLKKSHGALLGCRGDKKAAKFLAEAGAPFAMIKDPGAMDVSAAEAIVFDLPCVSDPDRALLDKAKKAGIRTVQIVHEGGEPAPVDILVGPCCGPAQPAIPATCHLAGAGFALLHHKFRHFHKARRKYRKKIRGIYIDLGDQLPYRDLRHIVDTLHRLRYQMRIAPGLSLKKADKRGLMRIYPGIHFCGRSESPARAYFEADLALIPPGEEALEAAAVGTPALYMPCEKGQEAPAEAWAARGTGVKIPSLADFSVQAVRDALAPLDRETREKMGAAGRDLVDGLGVQRFFKVLKENGIIE